MQKYNEIFILVCFIFYKKLMIYYNLGSILLEQTEEFSDVKVPSEVKNDEVNVNSDIIVNHDMKVKTKTTLVNKFKNTVKTEDRLYADALLHGARWLDYESQRWVLKALILDLINVESVQDSKAEWVENFKGEKIIKKIDNHEAHLTLDMNPSKERWFNPKITIKFPWENDLILIIDKIVSLPAIWKYVKVDLFENDCNFWIMKAIRKNATTDQLSILGEICSDLILEYPKKKERLELLRDKIIKACEKKQ